MRIMTSGGWVNVMLESMSVGVEDGSGVSSVSMILLFPSKAGLNLAALAVPDWIVHLDEERSESERILRGAMSKPAADSLEERVADAIMGDMPGGMVKVKSMTEMDGRNVDIAASVSGVGRVFIRVAGERKVKVEGHFMGGVE